MNIKEINAKSILRKHKKIDSWFLSSYGMNLYRGCIHNCVYCDGRSEKYNVDGEFGEDVTVKVNAIENSEVNYTTILNLRDGEVQFNTIQGKLSVENLTEEILANFRNSPLKPVSNISLNPTSIEWVSSLLLSLEDKNALKSIKENGNSFELLSTSTGSAFEGILFIDPSDISHFNRLNDFCKILSQIKTFEGEKIERNELVQMITDAFNVPSELIIEGYSMTEINGILAMCENGRFHLPPIIEPVILDEELVPQQGEDLKGAFGFLDPFAISYPGFIISGDNVRLQDGKCDCGMYGPGLTEVGRAPGREVKGCGGIMASVQA